MIFFITDVTKSNTNRHCYQVSICNRGDRKICNDIKEVFLLKKISYKRQTILKGQKFITDNWFLTTFNRMLILLTYLSKHSPPPNENQMFLLPATHKQFFKYKSYLFQDMWMTLLTYSSPNTNMAIFSMTRLYKKSMYFYCLHTFEQLLKGTKELSSSSLNSG